MPEPEPEPLASSYFLDLFARLPRQGPGSPAATARALELTGLASSARRILDVGCGAGAATLELARRTSAQVTGVDLLPQLVATLEARVQAGRLADRVSARVGDMAHLDALFPPASFDLIWCEGAIYVLGFEAGLRAWRPLVRPGGAIAVTEATWLTTTPPDPCRRYWAEQYPAMASAEANRHTAVAAGYELLGDFPLSASAWEDDYYAPLRALVAQERARPDLTDEERAVLDATEAELEVFDRFGDSYGYVFYVLRRPERP